MVRRTVWQSHVRVAEESSWGETPASGSSFGAPMPRYDVRSRPTFRAATPLAGVRFRKQGRAFAALVAGTIAPSWSTAKPTPLGDKSIIRFFLERAFGSTPAVARSPFLDSFSVEFSDSPGEGVRHSGLRVDRGFITGGVDTGIVELRLDCFGKSEQMIPTAEVPPPPVDAIQPREPNFGDVRIAFGPSPNELTPTAATGFTVGLWNALSVRRGVGMWPIDLTAGRRSIEVKLIFDKQDQSHEEFRRKINAPERSIRIDVHALTGAAGPKPFLRTRLTIQRAVAVDVQPIGESPDDVRAESATFACLKPDGQADDVTIEFTEVEQPDAP